MGKRESQELFRRASDSIQRAKASVRAQAKDKPRDEFDPQFMDQLAQQVLTKVQSVIRELEKQEDREGSDV